jgi:hypothetical protein
VLDAPAASSDFARNSAFQNTAIGFGAIATGDCTTSAAFGNQIRAHPLPLQQIASTE